MYCSTSRLAKLQVAALSLLVAVMLSFAAPQAQAQTSTSFNILPLKITSVKVVNGQLVANGKLGSHFFTTPITLSATPNASDPTCPILDLDLAPIHLNLLGLVVQTSAICLDINGDSGNGNLLGNLLCDIANLLNQGTPLSTILAGLDSTQISMLTYDLRDMLNTVLKGLTSSSAVAGVSGTSCNILNLKLGPVNLDLLGLVVHLDNCKNGPVRLRIYAVPGSLLGNLLCSLDDLLNNGGSAAQIDALLQQIASEIANLI
ncbi:MAG TPA: hypothetical protein VFA07_07155 [Chthonomonadaceae bacterium]|nr:hypothetical protein [Chthonomonadaceae bacterium]